MTTTQHDSNKRKRKRKHAKSERTFSAKITKQESTGVPTVVLVHAFVQYIGNKVWQQSVALVAQDQDWPVNP